MYLVLKSSFFYGLTMLRTENIFDTLIWGRVGEKRNHIYKCSVSPPVTGASQAVLVVNNLPTNAGDIRDVGLIPGKIPWRKKWQPTPVVLPGESPWTEEPGGLQPMGSKSWTPLSD